MKQIFKKINYLKVAEVLLCTVLLLAPVLTLAQANAQGNNLNQYFGCDRTSGLNCTSTNVNQLIRIIINYALGIAFGIAVLFLIIGGFFYITSAGNEESAEKGKNTAVNALIGIVIIIMSYVIVNVISNLASSNTGYAQPG